MIQIRCEDCSAVMEAEESEMPEVIGEHCAMHRLEEPVPPCLVLVMLPSEEFSIVIEL